jgi:RNA polymerase sigma factor (sigma-70 family)
VLPPKSPGQEDPELIREYKMSGKLDVLGKLFSPYTPMVYGVCLKYLKDREDAKDAVMQVFEKLIGTLKEHSVENFKSWLYITSRNYCLMQLRARKGKFTEKLSPQLMESSLILHLEEEPDLEDNLTQLEKCISRLADDQRSCVRLFFLEEKCYKDITSLTGFDLNKVKSYIQNGKRNLKICMEENG